MAGWVDLEALHTPTPGLRLPAAWGEGIVSNLELLSSIGFGEVFTSESTTSDTYGALSTAGPSVTVDTGERALVIVTARIANAADGDGGYMSHAVSGATTVAAHDSWSAEARTSDNIAYAVTVFGVGLHESLTPGVNIFTSVYRRGGAGTSVFARRKIVVVPLR